MTVLRWLDKAVLLTLHDESIAAHGGSAGVRDEGLLDSALMRPVNAHAYAGTEDVRALAALYAAAISGNHPFIDGNKRTAFLACGLFLRLNGLRLASASGEATEVMLSVAAGETDEQELAAWLRARTVPSSTGEAKDPK